MVGPTAVGKTKKAIELAQEHNTCILSADSRQIYKELDIGTAKPSKEELAAAKHYFINHISIHNDYSAGQYEKEALELLNQLFQEKDTVIVAGGTGLYIKGLCEGFDDIPQIDAAIRQGIITAYNEFGITYLQTEAKKVDASIASKIDFENPQRLMRFLEVYKGTGKNILDLQSQRKQIRNFNIKKIGLQMERSQLYDRINHRVDLMMAAGLLEEVKSLEAHKHLNALQTVGYTELFDFLDGKHDLPTAIELIKRNSRRYAKRQLTWWRRDKEIDWIEV